MVPDEILPGMSRDDDSLRRFRYILDRVPDVILVLDGETRRFVDANDAAVKNLGYSRDELIGMTPMDFVEEYRSYTPDDFDALLKRIQSAQHPTLLSETHRRKDGSSYPAETVVSTAVFGGRRYYVAIIRDISERITADMAVRKERDRAQNYLDIANVMMIALDHDGRVTLANRRAEEILGLPEEQILGRNWFEDFLPASAREAVMEGFRRIMSGDIESMEFHRNPVINANGEERIIDWRNAILRDHGGRITGTLSSGTDVTEQQQAETLLRENEQRLRTLTASTPTFIYEIDKGGRIIFSNRTYPGLGREQVEGTTLREWFPQEQHFRIDAALEKVFRKHKPVHLEYSIPNPDGELRHYTTEITPVHATGKVTSAALTATDITELHQAQAAQAQQARNLDLLYRVGRLAIICDTLEDLTSQLLDLIDEEFSSDLTVLWLKNSGGMQLAGSRGALNPFNGNPMTISNGTCLCGRAARAAEAIISEDITNDHDCDLDHCRLAGIRGFISLPLAVGSSMVGTLGLGWKEPGIPQDMEDILLTLADEMALAIHNAQLRKTLRKHMQELEDAVAQRTSQLQQQVAEIAHLNQTLLEMNARLRELDQLKSMFIASMSHELRTPLNSIIGFSGVLLRGISGDLTDRQRDQLQRISRSGKHLLNLITDVIDVSKIEADKIAVEISDFDLDGLIDEAIDTIDNSAREKGLGIVRDIEPGLSLHSDRRRLLQCLLNYLSNAVKFSRQGEVTISATMSSGLVHITVRDTGIGISETDLPRLFRPFERLEHARKSAVPGTGLGLYLTRKLARNVLGGDVSVVSQPGKGSAFSLSIPANIEAQPSSRRSARHDHEDQI